MAERRFRVGLLGHGTVGAAFATLLPQHADRIERVTGLRPELSGILTRSEGSFEQILERSDQIVELIGPQVPRLLVEADRKQPEAGEAITPVRGSPWR